LQFETKNLNFNLSKGFNCHIVLAEFRTKTFLSRLNNFDVIYYKQVPHWKEVNLTQRVKQLQNVISLK
jgi:hypothetical protein